MSTLALQPPASVATARRVVAQAFAAGSLEAADLDARLLIAHALRLDHRGLIDAHNDALGARDCARIEALARRRLKREPVSRIVGEKEFWSLPFVVNPDVLVPRPETEILVETALQTLQAEGRQRVRIADLGTGSGAILLALLHERRDAFGVGTDRSEPALRVAVRNAQRFGLSDRAQFVAGDFAGALRPGFDLVVSNPPYVARRDWADLEPEVRDHDPFLALDGGADGLDAYRRIATDAGRVLAPGGHLVVELGVDLEAGVTAVFAAAGLLLAGPPRRDLAGIPRALHLLRPA
jgi:release factor glutamine methyltransferase